MQKIAINLNDSSSISPEAPTGILEKISFILLLALPFLMPLFFIPSIKFPFQFSKIFLLLIIVAISFACWILARLKDGKFVFPAITITFAGLGVIAIAAISALFSGAVKWSFVGQNVELGTVASLATLFILMFLVPTVFRSKDKIFYAYLAFFAAFFLIAVFVILRLIFGVSFLSLGVFNDITSNMIGKWNDFGIFFGIGTVLSLVTLELVSLSRFFQFLLYLALAVSLFFLAIVNFTPVWYVISVFSLIFLVYIISFDKSEELSASGSSGEESTGEITSFRKIPMAPFIILIISLVFIIGGTTIGNAVASKFNINQIEARPSWNSTFDIAKSVMGKDPFLGAGPNKFTEKWLENKPNGINSTIFWNTDFNFGIGFVPTFLVTTGLLGAISWVIFLGLFLLVGFKAILSSVKDKIYRYLLISSFLTSLFLWIINIFYIPDFTIVTLTFFFTGLFIASIYQGNTVKPKIISFSDDPKKGFVSVLCLTLLLIGTIVSAYSFTEKYIASVYFQKGVVSFNNEGNIDKAEGYFLKATALDGSAAYYRSLVQVDLIRMSTLFSQNAKDVSADAVRAQFQGLLSSALSHAQQAVAISSTDYQNWVSLGQVYEAIVPLKIANAYESAVNSYRQAVTLNPKSPPLFLTLARLEATHGDNVKAKDYIRQALEQRNNYTEAIFLLAQIQVAEGNIKDAIDSVQAASYLSPNDSGIFFQLGLLRYNAKDFEGAASALERALVLNPSYANAKYFLGLSYQRLGRTPDAIAQFKDLKATNPDNTEIELILSNLLAGKSPFANAQPPIDNQPEKRSAPPVTEKASTKKTTTKTAPVTTDTVEANQ